MQCASLHCLPNPLECLKAHSATHTAGGRFRGPQPPTKNKENHPRNVRPPTGSCDEEPQTNGASDSATIRGSVGRARPPDKEMHTTVDQVG